MVSCTHCRIFFLARFPSTSWLEIEIDEDFELIYAGMDWCGELTSTRFLMNLNLAVKSCMAGVWFHLGDWLLTSVSWQFEASECWRLCTELLARVNSQVSAICWWFELKRSNDFGFHRVLVILLFIFGYANREVHSVSAFNSIFIATHEIEELKDIVTSSSLTEEVNLSWY